MAGTDAWEGGDAGVDTGVNGVVYPEAEARLRQADINGADLRLGITCCAVCAVPFSECSSARPPVSCLKCHAITYCSDRCQGIDRATHDKVCGVLANISTLDGWAPRNGIAGAGASVGVGAGAGVGDGTSSAGGGAAPRDAVSDDQLRDPLSLLARDHTLRASTDSWELALRTAPPRALHDARWVRRAQALLTYPLTLWHALRCAPSLAPALALPLKCSPRRRWRRVVHVVGASEAETGGGPAATPLAAQRAWSLAFGNATASTCSDGSAASDGATTSAVAAALVECPSVVVFIGPELPEALHDSVTRCACGAGPVLAHFRGTYEQYHAKYATGTGGQGGGDGVDLGCGRRASDCSGGSSVGDGDDNTDGPGAWTAPPDVIVGFNLGLTCPDYDWTVSLRSFSACAAARPRSASPLVLMLASNSFMELSLELEVLENCVPHRASTVFVQRSNPFLSPPQQSGTMANDVYYKSSCWLAAELLGDAEDGEHDLAEAHGSGNQRKRRHKNASQTHGHRRHHRKKKRRKR